MRVSAISVNQPINNYKFNKAELRHNYTENASISYKGIKGIAVGGGTFGLATAILVGAVSSFNVVTMVIAATVAAVLGGAFGHSVQQFNIEDKKNLERQSKTKVNR